MKILNLNFKNINSLKGEYTIDFTDEIFARNGLFAITGPTGSGKTTLLDAISLALFGEVPRLGKVTKALIEEKGAVLTRNQEEAFAQVTYTCAQGKFASIWSISTARTGNLRDYEMELVRLNPLERMDLKKSQVPAKNEELIGLSYSQFIKSVILAQGEFSKFLKAPKKERSALLEKITGTSIYRELGIEAYLMYAGKNREIESAQNLLTSQKEALLSAAERTAKGEELKVLDTALERMTARHSVLEGQIRLAKELQEIDGLLTLKTKALRDTTQKKEEFFKQYGGPMERHELVQEQAAAIQQWRSAREQLKGVMNEQEGWSKQEEKLHADQKKLWNEIQDFVHQKVDQEHVVAVLEEFYKKVRGLMEEREELRRRFSVLETAFDREAEELSLSQKAKYYVKETAQWEAVLLQIEQEGETLRSYFNGSIEEDVDRQMDGEKQRLHSIKNAQKEAQFVTALQLEVEKLEKNRHHINKQLKVLPKEIHELVQEVKLGEKEVDNLELQYKNQLLHVEVEVLREKLEEGKPCMVCGAISHPYASAALPLMDDRLEQKIKEAKTNLEKLKQRWTKSELKQESLIQQANELEVELSRKKERLLEQSTSFEQQYGEQVDTAPLAWEKKMKALEIRIEKLGLLKQTQNKERQVNRLRPIYQELQMVFTQGKAKALKVKEQYDGADILKDYQAFKLNWQRLNQQQEFIIVQREANAKKQERIRSGLDQIENTLLPVLQQKGFESIPEAQRSLLPGDTYKDYQQNLQEIRNAISELTSELRAEQRRKERLQDKITKTTSLTHLHDLKQELEQAIREKREEHSELQRILKNDQELMQHIAELEKSIAGQQHENLRWKLLNDLIGDAKGHKFNQFAQDLTLRHLLKLANKRLQHISERYRLAIKLHTDKNTDNLVISDLDMGGQERAVQTLSGGETFLMSLALALALSDLASKQVEINSLFIDEGFGTLDPETLDQTLDTLERLQAASNKTIGIISHVASLKERITAQIQVRQDGQGYSSLRILSV